jgi:DNA-binding CsgD family transcriptional regulator
MLRYCGYDPSETPIIPRGPASRFTDEQIDEMLQMAADGASGVEIAHALGFKAQSVRAKLNSLGVRLRRQVLATRLRMVISISRRMRLAADARGVTVQQLIRRLLQVTSRENLFDQLLPVVRARSLGAAAVHETPTPAGSGGGAAAVAGIPSPSAAAAFCIVLNQPRLMGCCARLG